MRVTQSEFSLFHLRCFVDLRFLPVQNTTKYNPAIFMIAETLKVNQSVEELMQSDVFVPHLEEAGEFLSCKAELLEVGRISGPVCVIPGLGNPDPRAFQAARSASDWPNLFERWIHQPFNQAMGVE